MTSKRYWSILILFLLILSLVLAACVRPMPGGDELISEETPAEAYPGPAESEDGSTAAYPAGEESSEAELIPPVEEDESAEPYPADESTTDEGEAAGEEAVEGAAEEAYPAAEDEEAEGSATAGAAEEAYPATEGETAEGEATEAEATETEAAQGEAAEGEAVDTEAPEGETAAAEAVETGRTHTVASGETLFQIGMQYGMSWVTIAQANDITNANSLYPGQVLIIPDVEDLEAADESSEAAEEPAAEEGAAEETTAEETTYIVQFGDTLYSISYRFGVSMMDIARENELASFDQIYAGQELIIPQADAEAEEGAEAEAEPGAAAATSEEGEVTHVVQEGETIFTIAFSYQIVWTDLVEANELESPYALEPGQTLIIPSGE